MRLIARALSQAVAFALPDPHDLAVFAAILPHPGGVVTASDKLQPMNRDWMGHYQGTSKVALRPKTTHQVSDILRHCNQRRLAVVPQGGNTGLVGGAVPKGSEIILSMSLMNKIREFDAVSGILVAEAGCVLQDLDAYVQQHNHTMPLDLGAKGSCQIGGNLATNAGGLRLLRYGSLHGNTLGIEAVLADGTIFDNLRQLRKDNTGYDLKQLFIGSEGTLGVITACALAVPPRPASVNVLCVACPSYTAVQLTFKTAKSVLGEILSAVEFEDEQTLRLVTTQLPARALDPLPHLKAPFYMVIETSGSNNAHDIEKIEAFMKECVDSGSALDAVLASNEKQRAALWLLREGAATALAQSGYVYKYDLSLPLSVLYSLVELTRKKIEGKKLGNVFGYGHIGDSNLHLNVTTPSQSDEVLSELEPFLFEFTAQHGGSISAEHGIGQSKTKYLHLSKSAPLIGLMREMKQVFDPNGILNPGKVLPPL
eukprot:TRINITY_DN1361_c0_g1_i1.p1 TRINITY_DN1361_c0_g1~~TRINITY_DN1361_c0_g1_i1.p1  ORF type:complete len:483 (+),score=94.22 TRINITY_DN1361_c0_g1_i1:71-1519(+)